MKEQTLTKKKTKAKKKICSLIYLAWITDTDKVSRQVKKKHFFPKVTL